MGKVREATEFWCILGGFANADKEDNALVVSDHGTIPHEWTAGMGSNCCHVGPDHSLGKPRFDCAKGELRRGQLSRDGDVCSMDEVSARNTSTFLKVAPATEGWPSPTCR
eukprot:scaffold7153_cov255-Prasinococcus_capsulatus_cf.AAC.2